MKRLATAFIAASALAGGAHAAAPNAAICAVEQVAACPAYGECARTLPGAVNLPVLLKIDRAAGEVISRLDDGTNRTSAIGSEVEAEDNLILQGVDAGHPWGLRVELSDGRFVLVSAQAETGFTAFGRCSASLLQ